MKVLISIWSLASGQGGPTRSTIGIAKALSAAGVDVVLVSHVPGVISDRDRQALRESGVVFWEGRGNGLLTALADSSGLVRDIKPDIVHLQGLWKMSTHAMNVMAFRQDVPIVVSPRGMLDPWALSVKSLKKKVGMALYQRRDLDRATAFHAASPEEAEHIEAQGFSQPIIIAPNAVDLPGLAPRSASGGSTRTALFLSRLHPGKGLLLLAEAWGKVRPKGWKIRVVGPDGYGHKKEVVAAIESLGISEDWQFDGEISDKDKWAIYQSADLFIHPSASENFGISIAEALASGLPVITTKGCPWGEIQGRCGWWIDRNVDALASAMREAMGLDDSVRCEMGEKGRELIEEKYTWGAVARKMIKGYEMCLDAKRLK